MSGFSVTPEALHSHAESVDHVAESVDEAATAAGTERAGGLVYGVFFDVVAREWLNMWADQIEGLTRTAGETGHSIAEGIKANADTYDAIDKANAKHIRKAGG